MYNYIEDYGYHIEISAFRDVTFQVAEEYLRSHRKQKQSVDIQFFDADLVATKEHLYFATINALQAFRAKTNICKSLAMETLLYASTQRQIQKAISKSGIKSETKNIAILLIAQEKQIIESTLNEISTFLGKSPDESLLSMNNDKEKKLMKTFDISIQEIETVKTNHNTSKTIVNLIIERMAILATKM